MGYPFSFSIGNKEYVGTGGYTLLSFSNEFWECDPSSNVWTQKANFEGGAVWDIPFISQLEIMDMLDMALISKGIYFVELDNSEQKAVKKL